MKKNMGTADRAIRIIAAAIICYLAYKGTLSGVTGIILLVLSIVFVLTSFVGFCPIYKLLGIRTRPAKVKK